MEAVGNNYIDGYQLVHFKITMNCFEVAPIFVFCIIIFDLTFSELRVTRFYFFYPESFFDRNWYVIIQSALTLYLFKENWQIVIIVAAIVMVVNDLFRKWRTKKQMIVIENLKKLSFYPDFDATKFKFKHYQKNFFLRSWHIFVVPWSLIIVSNSETRGHLMFLIFIAFFIFEAVGKINAIKEIEKVVKIDGMI